jgi:GT2 family glycosyltransferase
MKKVYISLVTYKNHDITVQCLRSIEKLHRKGISLSVIVVNNDTEKEFNYKVTGEVPVVILQQERNLGFAGGHNVVLRKAMEEKASYVVVLNNDTVLDEELLQELVHAAEETPEGGVFAPKIYFAPGHEFHGDRYTKEDAGKVLWYAGGQIDWENMLITHRGVDAVDTGQFEKTEETDFASGCCMLVPVSILRTVGLFDERYFLYLEDSDLNERIKRVGKKILFVPKAKLWHENAGSTGGSGSTLQDYYISRNRLLFGYRYAPLRTKIALFKESLQLLRIGRTWQKKGVADYYSRHFAQGRYTV